MICIGNKVFLISALTALGACGGGGTNAPAEQAELFFGSTDPAASRSGLDYADGTQQVDDLTGQTHTVRVARTIVSTRTGLSEQIITDEVVTLGAPEIDGQVENFTLTLDGETLEFIDRVGERGDGTKVTLFGSDIAGEYVAAFRLGEDLELGGRDGEFTSTHFVTGFETNPAIIALDTGSTTYIGNVIGVEDGDTLGLELFDGTLILNANFADSMVDGVVSLNAYDTSFLAGTFDLELAPTAITGNGFANDLTLTDCSFENCESNSSIGGVFFGPNAEEVGGVLSVDFTADRGVSRIELVGTGAFTGEDDGL